MQRLSLAVIAAFAFSVPAFAADTTPASKSGQADKKPAVAQDDSKKVVCERRHVVGSNIESKVCKTKAEWEADRVAAQQMAQDHATSGNPVSGR